MSSFHLTPDAQADLIEIRRYSKKHWGVVQSQKYTSELRRAIRLLSETPLLGKLRVEIAPNVLSFPYANHVIYYIVHEQKLIVFGLLHKRMVPFHHLADRKTLIEHSKN